MVAFGNEAVEGFLSTMTIIAGDTQRMPATGFSMLVIIILQAGVRGRSVKRSMAIVGIWSTEGLPNGQTVLRLQALDSPGYGSVVQITEEIIGFVGIIAHFFLI